jgi:hypothetical protein
MSAVVKGEALFERAVKLNGRIVRSGARVQAAMASAGTLKPHACGQFKTARLRQSDYCRND